jgi:hypothetical protein
MQLKKLHAFPHPSYQLPAHRAVCFWHGRTRPAILDCPTYDAMLVIGSHNI